MYLPPDLILKLKSLKTPAIIAISGFGGSGKSLLAKSLGMVLSAPVISIDSFMKPGAFNTVYNLWEIMDFSRLEDEVLKPFFNKEGVITYGHFEPKLNKISQTIEVKNNGLLMVEGVGLFRTNLLPYFTYTIWIDCPIELAIARGKKRDREEYGSPTDELWDGLWKKNDLEFYRKFRPLEIANYVVDGTKVVNLIS
jgi:uridine kinase